MKMTKSQRWFRHRQQQPYQPRRMKKKGKAAAHRETARKTTPRTRTKKKEGREAP